MAKYEQLISETKKYQKSFNANNPHGDEVLLAVISKIYKSLNSLEQRRYLVEYLFPQVNVNRLVEVLKDTALVGAASVAAADFCLTGPSSALRCAAMGVVGCVSSVCITTMANSFFGKLPTLEESYYKLSAFYKIMDKINITFNGNPARIRTAFLHAEKWYDKAMHAPKPLTMHK